MANNKASKKKGKRKKKKMDLSAKGAQKKLMGRAAQLKARIKKAGG